MKNSSKTLKSLNLMPLMLTILLVTAGCVGLTQDIQYRRPAAANPTHIRENNAFRLSIDPIFDANSAKEVFGYDPNKLGILPIHVSIENTSADASLIVQKQQFQLSTIATKNSNVAKDATVYRSETEGKIGNLNITPGQRAFSTVVGIIFGGGGIREYSSEINHNFTREELLDTTMQPGQKVSGCVYFRVPDRSLVERYRLEATITELGTKKKHLIEIDINNVVGR